MANARFWFGAAAFTILLCCGCSRDRTPPVIELVGDESIEIAWSSAYADPGASAIDDVDGPVEVITSGEIDLTTPGVYVLTYTATDSADNVATATRTVSVAPPTAHLDVSSFGELDISVDGHPALSCAPGGDVCSGEFELGSTLVLRAAAGSGWAFEYWRNCDSTIKDVCTVSLDEDRVVLATASRTDPLEYHPDVVFLDDVQMAGLLSYDEIHGVLVFSAWADLTNISVGNVVVSTGARGLADAMFARRVVDVISLAGSPTILETIPVSLDEVVRDGSLLVRPEDFIDIEPVQLASGVTLLPPSGPPGFRELAIAGLELYDRDGVTVTVSGTLGLRFDHELAVDFAWPNKIRYARVSASLTVDTSFVVDVTGEVPGGLDEIFPMKRIFVASLPPVAGVPIVVEMEPFVSVKAGVGAAVGVRVWERQDGVVGAQWHQNSGWTNLSSFQVDGDVQYPEETFGASGRFDIGAGVKTIYKLWGLAGPFHRVSLYGGGELTYLPAQECSKSLTTFVGGRTSVGGEVGAFGRYLAIELNDIFFEIPLSTDTFGCDDDKEAPTAPEPVTATAVGKHQIAIEWGASTDNVAVAQYEVWRQDPEGWGIPHLARSTTALAHLDAGLQPEGRYCYYVLAVDAAGNKSEIPIDFACAVTHPLADQDPPTAPVLEVAEALSTSSVHLMWAASDDNVEVAGYIVSNATELKRIYPVGVFDELEASLTQLDPGQEYCFTVRAFDTSGNESEESNRLCVSTYELDAAEWTVYLGCQGRPFQVQTPMDLDQSVSTSISVVGTGQDYNGINLAYILQGVFSETTQELAADITWTFEGISLQRLDRFTVDLSTGDSGVVPMTQVQVTGCDAQIQVVRGGAPPPAFLTRPLSWGSVGLGG